MIKKIIFFVALFSTTYLFSQENNNELSFNEFLGYVKKFHPLVKSSQLQIGEAQAQLMMSRGAFDPKIEIDYDTKEFKSREYYSILNSTFKIPTWYGIEVKAAFDTANGYYLNPQNTLPQEGLLTLGVSVPVGQGLFINKRMADLRQAKIGINLNANQQLIEATQVLYNASIAYFNWKKAFDEVQLYQNYLSNADARFKGVKTMIESGDKPAIDSVETAINFNTRKLNLENAELKLQKAKLELSNFLWIENNVPVEIQEGIIPEKKLLETIEETLKTNSLFTQNFFINNHPKLQALQNKIDILDIERKLKANMLLPKIDLQYNYLSQPAYWSSFYNNNYKWGVNFAFPLFLRKERGGLQLTKLKIQDNQYALDIEKTQISNKLKASVAEIESLRKQNRYINGIVNNSKTLLEAEEKIFTIGESSVFMILSRENSLISSSLLKIDIENKFFTANAEYFKTLANP